MFDRWKKKKPVQCVGTGEAWLPFEDEYDPRPNGYQELSYIGSDWTVIRFAVPAREWNSLQKSSEWIAFRDLFEERQKEFLRIQHQAVEEREEI